MRERGSRRELAGAIRMADMRDTISASAIVRPRGAL